MKLKCLERIRELDIPTVLVPTVSKGDNSDELGALVQLGLETDQVSSIVIQPMAHTGDGGDRYHGNPAGHRLTMPEVHQLLEEQLPWFKRDYWHPAPCSHPSCYTATYLFRMEDGRYVALPEFVNIRQYLDAMANRAILRSDDALEKMLLDSITNLWSATKVGESSAMILASMDAGAAACGLRIWGRRRTARTRLARSSSLPARTRSKSGWAASFSPRP